MTFVPEVAKPVGSHALSKGRGTDLDNTTYVPEISPCVTAKWSEMTGGPAGDECQNLVAPPLTTRPYCDNLSRENGVVVVDETQVTSKANRSNPKAGDPCHPLTESGRPPIAVIGFDKSQYGNASEEIAQTLRCNGARTEGVNDGKSDNQCIAFQPGSITDGRGSPAMAEVSPALKAESDGDTRQCVAFHMTQDPINEEELAPCQSGQAQATTAISFQRRMARNDRGQPETEIVAALTGADAGATSDMRPCVPHTEPVAFRGAGQDGFIPDTIAPPLAATDGGGAGVPFMLHSQNSCAMQKEGDGSAGKEAEVARALDTTGGFTHGQGGNVVARRHQVRRLTPKECERIQGFPDDWTLEAVTEDGAVIEQKDSPRYRQIGNAVTVTMAYWFGLRISQHAFPTNDPLKT